MTVVANLLWTLGAILVILSFIFNQPLLLIIGLIICIVQGIMYFAYLRSQDN